MIEVERRVEGGTRGGGRKKLEPSVIKGVTAHRRLLVCIRR